MKEIWKLEDKEQSKLLRRKTQDFDFSDHSRDEIDELVMKMRRIMGEANGIGLAANQIGLDVSVFVAKWEGKFYAFFNPQVEVVSKETDLIDEGCLSIPGKFGEVERPLKIVLTAYNKQGKKVKIKAWDMLARIFQHEVDHLEGKLYIDRMKRGMKLRETQSDEGLNYVFFGSPELAGIVLQKLVESGMPPKKLVCNVDKPVGRKRIITPPVTKQLVLENGWPIQIFQPKDKAELEDMSKRFLRKADFAVVAAYGKLLPDSAIKESRLGVIGVHPSLLPMHRGPSPIRSSILAGDEVTGSSLFLIDEKMDEGPLLAQEKLKIDGMNNKELMTQLAHLSGDMLVELLPSFVEGEIKPKEQDHKKATYTKFFQTEDGYVVYSDLEEALNGDIKKALRIDRMVRALGIEPGVYTFIKDKRTKILESKIIEGKLVLKKIQTEGKNPTFLA